MLDILYKYRYNILFRLLQLLPQLLTKPMLHLRPFKRQQKCQKLWTRMAIPRSIPRFMTLREFFLPKPRRAVIVFVLLWIIIVYIMYFYRIACCNSDNGISVFSFKNLFLTAQFWDCHHLACCIGWSFCIRMLQAEVIHLRIRIIKGK